jgi:hypothetical protein
MLSYIYITVVLKVMKESIPIQKTAGSLVKAADGLLGMVLRLKEPEPAVINKVKYPPSHSSKPTRPTNQGTIQFGKPVMRMMPLL